MRLRALNLRKGQVVFFVSKWKLICYLGCVEFKDKFKACCLGLLNIFG